MFFFLGSVGDPGIHVITQVSIYYKACFEFWGRSICSRPYVWMVEMRFLFVWYLNFAFTVSLPEGFFQAINKDATVTSGETKHPKKTISLPTSGSFKHVPDDDFHWKMTGLTDMIFIYLKNLIPKNPNGKIRQQLPKTAFHDFQVWRCHRLRSCQGSHPRGPHPTWTNRFWACWMEIGLLSPPRPNFQIFWQPLGKTILKETRKV